MSGFEQLWKKGDAMKKSKYYEWRVSGDKSLIKDLQEERIFEVSFDQALGFFVEVKPWIR